MKDFYFSPTSKQTTLVSSDSERKAKQKNHHNMVTFCNSQMSHTFIHKDKTFISYFLEIFFFIFTKLPFIMCNNI